MTTDEKIFKHFKNVGAFLILPCIIITAVCIGFIIHYISNYDPNCDMNSPITQLYIDTPTLIKRLCICITLVIPFILGLISSIYFIRAMKNKDLELIKKGMKFQNFYKMGLTAIFMIYISFIIARFFGIYLTF